MSMNKEKNSQYTIRKVDYHDRKDAQALLGLLDHYARDSMGGGEPLSNYVVTNLITELQKHYGAFSVIAFDDNLPVGLVNCFQAFSTFKCRPLINIHDVIVRDSHRGHGLAEKMLDKVQQHAKEIGCCKLTLEVLQGNDIAKKVYQRFGFNAYELDPSKGNALFWEKVI